MEYQELKKVYHTLGAEDGLPGFPGMLCKMRKLTKMSRPKAAEHLQVPLPTLKNHELGMRKAMPAATALCYMLGLGAPGEEALRNNLMAMMGLDEIRFPAVVVGGTALPNEYHFWSGGYSQNIRTIRKMCQLSRPKFAELVGMPPSTIKNYELGYRSLSLTAAVKIAIATSDDLVQAVARLYALLAINIYFKK